MKRKWEWENQTINIQRCAGLFVENSQTKSEKNCSYFLYCISFKKHFLLPKNNKKKSNICKNRDISTMGFFFLTPRPTTSNSGAPHSLKFEIWIPTSNGPLYVWVSHLFVLETALLPLIQFRKVMQSRWPENFKYRTNQSPFSTWTLKSGAGNSIRSWSCHCRYLSGRRQHSGRSCWKVREGAISSPTEHLDPAVPDTLKLFFILIIIFLVLLDLVWVKFLSL